LTIQCKCYKIISVLLFFIKKLFYQKGEDLELLNEVLTMERVKNIYFDSLFRKGEYPLKKFVLGLGPTHKRPFHHERIFRHRDSISEMLNELPDEFHEKKGSEGVSILGAFIDNKGNQWAGLQENLEQLFQIGMAVGKLTCPIPEDMWSMLPKKVPYYFVNTGFKPVKIHSV
jgi:hypothetical protein